VFQEFKFENEDASLDEIENNLLRKLNIKGKILVDMGGGYGRLSSIFVESFEKIYVLDYSRYNLIRLRSSPFKSRIFPIQGDFTDVMFKKETVDAIISFRAIHHYETPLFIKKWLEYLVPGGRLYFNIDNLENITLIYDRLFKRKIPLKGNFNVLCTFENGIRFCFHSRRIIYEIFKEEILFEKVSIRTLNYGFLHRKFVENIVFRKFPKLQGEYFNVRDGNLSRFLYSFTLFEVEKI